MIDNPGISVPEATNRWSDAKAFHRLLAQPELTSETVFQAHREGTLRRAAESGE